MALPTASDNLFPKVNLDMQTSDPAAPSGEDWKVYAKPGGIYARSSNTIVGPFGAGSGVSAGSNATRVAAASAPGTGSFYSLSDHQHSGIATVTSSASNTLGRPNLNFRAGANVGITATDSDGDGSLDTITISSTAAASGGGGSSLAAAVSVQNTGADYTTTSASYADIDATNLSHTITTGAHRVKVTLACAMKLNNTANAGNIDVLVDGTGIGGNGAWQFRPIRASENYHTTFTYVTAALTAASHTIKLQWKVDGNTLSLVRNGQPCTFLVEELPI